MLQLALASAIALTAAPAAQPARPPSDHLGAGPVALITAAPPLAFTAIYLVADTLRGHYAYPGSFCGPALLAPVLTMPGLIVSGAPFDQVTGSVELGFTLEAVGALVVGVLSASANRDNNPLGALGNGLWIGGATGAGLSTAIQTFIAANRASRP